MGLPRESGRGGTNLRRGAATTIGDGFGGSLGSPACPPRPSRRQRPGEGAGGARAERRQEAARRRRELPGRRAAGLCAKSREPALNARVRASGRDAVEAGLLHVPGGRGQWAWPLGPRPRHAPGPLCGRGSPPSLFSPGPSVARSPLGAMASRLLHRLRHALASDGPGEAAAAAGPEAEQFPESSELEDDDAEGLSSRLSGTLSFTSAEDDPDDEDEDDEAGLDSPPSGDGTSGEDAGECGRIDGNPGAR